MARPPTWVVVYGEDAGAPRRPYRRRRGAASWRLIVLRPLAAHRRHALACCVICATAIVVRVQEVRRAERCVRCVQRQEGVALLTSSL